MADTATLKTQMLPLAKCVASKTNPRTALDAAALAELTASVTSQGVLEPVLARAVNGKFEIIAGARRLEAAKRAKLEAIPARLLTCTDREALEIQIVENQQRVDIHPLEEAAGYAALVKMGAKPEEIATKVGMSASYIYQRLKLADLMPEVRKAFADGAFSAGHAILIARLDGKGQTEAANRAKYNSVRDLQHYIETHLQRKLASAPWDLADAKLAPKAGACTACRYNTANRPGEQPGRCLNAPCYEGKMQALVEQRLKESQLVRAGVVPGNEGKKDTPPLVPVTESSKRNTQPKGTQALYSDVSEIRPQDAKKNPHAQRAIVVDGDRAGKEIWVLSEKRANRTRSPDEKKWAARAREEKTRQACNKTARAAVARQAIQVLKRRHVVGRSPTIEDLRILTRAVLRKTWTLGTNPLLACFDITPKRDPGARERQVLGLAEHAKTVWDCLEILLAFALGDLLIMSTGTGREMKYDDLAAFVKDCKLDFMGKYKVALKTAQAEAAAKAKKRVAPTAKQKPVAKAKATKAKARR